ncbi:ATPase [Alistipes sp.]|uniref:ATPase n=1 Tax=Alistipes sp. TaxID=1872444 RepID=UPI003AF1D7E4
MILIADSGSTQCTWLLAERDGVRRIRTPGINALHQTGRQVLDTLALVPPCAEVDEVHFYGAGCGPQFPEATRKMATALRERFGAPRIGVESDLLGAARALFGRGEGIACILGTGSNSCHCRGGGIVATVPPLGYILGDEGSGAVLGRNLLNGVFKGHIPLREELLTATGMTYEQILRRVYAEPAANRFLASLAPVVCAHTAVPEVREMVVGSFRQFAARNLGRYPADLPVSFVGGVAAHFGELLRTAMHEAGRRVQRIVQSPADGLIAYHDGR